MNEFFLINLIKITWCKYNKNKSFVKFLWIRIWENIEFFEFWKKIKILSLDNDKYFFDVWKSSYTPFLKKTYIHGNVIS